MRTPQKKKEGNEKTKKRKNENNKKITEDRKY